MGERILTIRNTRLRVPVELGAELDYASADEVTEIARQCGSRYATSMVSVGGECWRFRAGVRSPMAEDDFSTRLHRVMRYLDARPIPDRSFTDFLAATAARVSRQTTRRPSRHAHRIGKSSTVS